MSTDKTKSTPEVTHLLTSKQYDLLKFVTGIVLPAFGTLYFALAEIWHLPAAQQVLGTIIAIQAFLGALLGISSKSYEDSGAKYVGAINVQETPEKLLYSLTLKDDPLGLKDRKEATFQINNKPPIEDPVA